MSKPDIVISESETTVIERIDVRESTDDPPKFRMDPGGSGRLRLGAETVAGETDTGREGGGDGSWDIELSPKWGTVNLGGGAGENSDGDLKLYDNPDDATARPRVHLSGGGGSGFESTRTYLGGDGRLRLGGSGEQGSIRLSNPDGETTGTIGVGDAEEMTLGGDQKGGVVGLFGPDENLNRVPSLGLTARSSEDLPGDSAILSPGGLFIQFVRAMQGNRIQLLGDSEGDGEDEPRIELNSLQDEDDTQEIRKTTDGVVITDASGNPAVQVDEDGTVSVTDGTVEKL